MGRVLQHPPPLCTPALGVRVPEYVKGIPHADSGISWIAAGVEFENEAPAKRYDYTLLTFFLSFFFLSQYI